MYSVSSRIIKCLLLIFRKVPDRIISNEANKNTNENPKRIKISVSRLLVNNKNTFLQIK